MAAKASASGIKRQFFDALDFIIEQLKNRPDGWGDPEWHTRQPGGVVYHGFHPLLVARYVVFEAERLVILLNLKAMPRSVLDSP